MPTVQLPVASVTWAMVDETGSPTSFQLNFGRDEEMAGALVKIANTTAHLEDISGCAVLSTTISYSSIQTDPPAAQPVSRREKKGVFSFRTQAGKTATYAVPGIRAEFVKKSGQIDEDIPAIVTFVEDLIAGAGGAFYTDSNGSPLASLVKAYERFQKTTKAGLPSLRIPDGDTTVGN